MKPIVHKTPAPGWVGGFEESNPDFAYPKPDLSSLKMLDNLANINLLDRQQAVLWPEFSWETQKDEADKKLCFQMFAPDISRLGYTNEGRVYSIICPQQGTASASIGALNVEVTVTGNRGWANETDKSIAANMTVRPKIWFSPGADQNWIVSKIWDKFASSDRPFPSDKANAMELNTYNAGQPDNPIFVLNKGESTGFPIPDFARHPDEAWSVGHLSVEIGAPISKGDPVVDEFNKLVMEAFNLAAGNMLQEGNVLCWNVWFEAPQIVDRDEWADHAEKWRKSIDADHGSPDGPGTDPRYYNGDKFVASEALKEREEAKFLAFIKDHFGGGI